MRGIEPGDHHDEREDFEDESSRDDDDSARYLDIHDRPTFVP